MSVILAVNFEDRLVLLEDGRELKITGFYANRTFPQKGPHRVGSALLKTDRVESWEDAEVFVAEFPGTGGVHLIVEIATMDLAQPKDIN